MLDAILNTLYLQRHPQVMRNMELSEREIPGTSGCVPPTTSKQIKRWGVVFQCTRF